MRNAYERSQDDEVLLADPVDLIVMLYRAAVQSVQKARRAITDGDVHLRGQQISRGSAILAELAILLNHEVGGALSQNLAELYDYLQRVLQAAHQEQSDEKLRQAESLLTTLLEAWYGCQQQLSTQKQLAGLAAHIGPSFAEESIRSEAVSYNF